MPWLPEVARCTSAHYFRVEPFQAIGVFLGAASTCFAAFAVTHWWRRLAVPRRYKETRRSRV